MSVLSDVHLTYTEYCNNHAITRFKFDYAADQLDKKKKKKMKKKNISHRNQCKNNSQHKEDETSIKLQNQTSHLDPNIASHSGLDPSTLQKSQSVEERVKKQDEIKSERSQTVKKAEEINPSVILQTELMDQTCVCDSDFGIKDTTNGTIMASVESENISEDQAEQIDSTIDYDSDGDLQVVRKGELTDDDREEMCITITIKEPSGRFTLSSRDLEMIKHSDVFIAADVIYDDSITDAFFSTIKYLMSFPQNKTLFIALERRLVFTIDDLDVSSPGYNHFRRHLTNLTKIFFDSTSSVKYSVEQLDTDFPQFFHYKRTNYLELWKVTSTIDKT